MTRKNESVIQIGSRQVGDGAPPMIVTKTGQAHAYVDAVAARPVVGAN